MWIPRRLAGLDELVWDVVDDFKQWEAVPTRFVSPAHLFVSGGQLPADWPASMLFQTGPFKPLLRHAAECAYFGLNKFFVKRLLKDQYKKEPVHGDAATEPEVFRCVKMGVSLDVRVLDTC